MEDGTIAPLAAKVEARLAQLERKRDKKKDRRRWTKYRLAVDMGISHGYLYNLLHRNTDVPRKKILAKLCRALHCQPGELLEYIPPTNGLPQGKN